MTRYFQACTMLSKWKRVEHTIKKHKPALFKSIIKMVSNTLGKQKISLVTSPGSNASLTFFSCAHAQTLFACQSNWWVVKKIPDARTTYRLPCVKFSFLSCDSITVCLKTLLYKKILWMLQEPVFWLTTNFDLHWVQLMLIYPFLIPFSLILTVHV